MDGQKDGWWMDVQVDRKGEMKKRTSISRNFSLFPAAVDYLAKNVSLSTQRRMKLGEHSAVLGLLPVETGQAY